MGRERRRRAQRTTTVGQGATPAGGQSAPVAAPAVPSAPARPVTAPAQVRSDRVLMRESATMISELKRVALVSGVCFGMLAVLIVVDRIQ